MMSRSVRRTPCMPCGGTQKQAKRYARKALRQRLNQWDPEGERPPPVAREVSNVFDFPKDGKAYISPDRLAEGTIWWRK